MDKIWKYLTFLFLTLFTVIFFKTNLHSKIANKFFPPVYTEMEKSIDYAYWNDRVTQFSKMSCAGKIVFVGNSLTDAGEWGELLSRKDIANRGISADFSYGVYTRIGQYLKDKPKAVFLKIGINDIWNNVPLDTVKSYMSKIIQTVMAEKVPLYVQSTLFTGVVSVYPYARTNELVKDLNLYVEKECKSKGVIYIDLNKALSVDNILASSYTNDGIHLNGDGYEAWKYVLQPYIDQIPQ